MTDNNHQSNNIAEKNEKDVEIGNEKCNGDQPHHEDLDHEPSSWLEKQLAQMNNSRETFVKKNSSNFKIIWKFAFNGIVWGFFFACLYYWMVEDDKPLELCNGFGSLIALFTIVYGFCFYFLIIKKYFGKWLNKNVWSRIERGAVCFWSNCILRSIFVLAIVICIATFLYFDTAHDRSRLISLLGIFLILFFSFLFSKYPGRVRWNTVIAGLCLQLAFGIIFIRWTLGRNALQCFADKVTKFLSYGIDGSAFVFGDLLVRTEGVFAFSTLPVIFFFSMLIEVLFFYGALQWFCLKLGQLLRSATNTTVCESVIAVGNTFLGMTESSLIVKPYIPVLTPSELHVIMCSGFGTVSGTILAAYIGFGAEPAHLVTASVMSAPTSICISKLLMPETRKSKTSVDNIVPVECQDQSALSAATRGATNGISLILNVIANLIAFVAFVAFVNGVLGYCGSLLGFSAFSLEFIFGKIFIPICWVMGVPWAECELVGTLVGMKTVVNEFVAYQYMGELKLQGLLSPRAELIATYALCGFTNPSSAAIMIGAISAMAPNQREVLSSIALRAFFGGCGICFMNACTANLLMPDL